MTENINTFINYIKLVYKHKGILPSGKHVKLGRSENPRVLKAFKEVVLPRNVL